MYKSTSLSDKIRSIDIFQKLQKQYLQHTLIGAIRNNITTLPI